MMLLRVAESFLQLRSVRSIFISVADDPRPVRPDSASSFSSRRIESTSSVNDERFLDETDLKATPPYRFDAPIGEIFSPGR